MANIKYSDLLNAFDLISSGPECEERAFIELSTGKIEYSSIEPDFEEDEDGDEEEIDLHEGYIEIPHKNEFDLGRSLALSFAAECIPGDYEAVCEYFHRRGAYRRFKQLLETRGIVDKWYDYEQRSIKEALVSWCEENGILVLDDKNSN